MLKYIKSSKVSVFVDGFSVMNYGVCLYENSWKSPSAEAACSKRLCRRVCLQAIQKGYLAMRFMPSCMYISPFRGAFMRRPPIS